MDRDFSLDSIETLIEERPVVARLLVGVIGATAATMAIGLIWARSDASALSLLIGMIGIVLASTLIVATTLPLECKIGPGNYRSLPCRLQARRFVVDSIAFAVALLVIVNVFVAAV